MWVADQNEEIVGQVPLLVLLDLLMTDIQRTGEVKLTPKGNLPVVLCTNLYQLDDDGHYGQMGVWYSLWLLLKYGDERREASFYLEKWRKVFDRSSEPNRIEEYAYFVRFFDSFCRWFGLARVEERHIPGQFQSMFLVEKSELLGKIFAKK